MSPGVKRSKVKATKHKNVPARVLHSCECWLFLVCNSSLQWVPVYITRYYSGQLTGSPNGPVMFCSLASVVVCRLSLSATMPWSVGCRRAGRWTRALSSGRLHGGPVRLRTVRATPCITAHSDDATVVRYIVL